VPRPASVPIAPARNRGRNRSRLGAEAEDRSAGVEPTMCAMGGAKKEAVENRRWSWNPDLRHGMMVAG
jgi:hypothetical protein